jgi:general stress protein 26
VTRKELYGFMSQQKLAVVGSISVDGSPQSALVGIAVTDALEIIFDTLSSSRKYANLTRDPRASIVLGWLGEVTVQVEGTAYLPEGAELARYKQVYFAAWTDGREHEKWPGIAYFVIRPNWLRYSDFDQRPPQIEEFRF